jgi:hypothetical protein
VTPSLIPKVGVAFARIAPAGGAILAAAAVIALKMRRDLVITSGTDSHPPTDPHATGEAYDFSVQGFSEAEILTLVQHFRTDLGARFTALYETPIQPAGVLASLAYVNAGATAPHVHVQRAKGTSYEVLT